MTTRSMPDFNQNDIDKAFKGLQEIPTLSYVTITVPDLNTPVAIPVPWATRERYFQDVPVDNSQEQRQRDLQNGILLNNKREIELLKALEYADLVPKKVTVAPVVTPRQIILDGQLDNIGAMARESYIVPLGSRLLVSPGRVSHSVEPPELISPSRNLGDGRILPKIPNERKRKLENFDFVSRKKMNVTEQFLNEL